MADIGRAARVLDTIARGRVPLTLTEVTTRSGLPRSTVHRLLRALENEHFVSRSSDGGGYSLGSGCLGIGLDGYLRLVTGNRSRLMKVSSTVGETAELTVLRGNGALVVDQVASRTGSLDVLNIGARLPLHATGSGKALLAKLGRETRDRLLVDALTPITANTVTDRDVLERQLEKVAQLGIAVEREECRAGMCTLSTAFTSPTGDLQAIAVVLPANRFAHKFGLSIDALHRVNSRIDAAAARRHYQP